MKQLLKSVLRTLGFEIYRCLSVDQRVRAVGGIRFFLEGVRERGFIPKGIVDVGAYNGDWTRIVLGVFPSAPTIMIEPQDEMEIPLNALCRESPTCRCIKVGVGKDEGESIQTIWDDLAGSSFIPEIDPEKLRLGRQRRTKITTIDSILSQKGYRDFQPDLVKLDVQGFELEVLTGAEFLFGKTELFIIETSLYNFLPKQPITRDVIAFMAERGYEFYDITEYSVRPYDGAFGQIDLAFVKKEGRFRETNRWSK